MEFLRQTLKNGFEIIAEADDNAHTMAVGFFVKTGARDESDEVSGVSHFLEHMVFKGTPTRKADDVNREFDEMGAYYNAFTSEENTVFYAAVLPEFQSRSVALLADIMRPSLRKDDFDTEKKVIVEEICMYEDQPPYCIDDRCRALHFADHPLGRSVLGTVDSINDLTVDQMRGYFDDRYSPHNIVLAAAGRVDFEALVDQADQVCGPWELRPSERVVPDAQHGFGFHVIQRENSTQQYAVQLAGGPRAEDENRFAAKLLATVVGDDCGSRLYWELVDPGLAEQASLAHYEYEGAGVFMGYLSCDSSRMADNLQRVHDVYRAVEKSGIDAEELAQAKSKVKARVVLGSERPRNRLFVVGGNWTHRAEYRSVKDDLDAVDSVNLDQIPQVLVKFPLSRNTTVTVGPQKEVAAPRG